MDVMWMIMLVRGGSCWWGESSLRARVIVWFLAVRGFDRDGRGIDGASVVMVALRGMSRGLALMC